MRRTFLQALALALGLGAISFAAHEAQADDTMKLKGVVNFKVFDKHGNLKEERTHENLIVTAGKNALLLASAAKYINQFAYIAVGTSATAPAITDTALGAQVAISSVITPTNPTAPVYQCQYTFAAGVATGALAECGLFSAASAGIMLSHLTFSVINVAATDTIQITYQLS